tara:strand:- start:289 stop:903 length:615 start_codon:yes stop_codon:yes gene_type:complete
MQQQLCVLLYSDYSDVCKNLFKALESCPIDIYGISGMKNLCIDNEKLRKRILINKNISITSVPSLLIVYNNSQLEKLEGQKVFDWIDVIVNENLPPPPPPPPKEENDSEEEEEIVPVKKVQKKKIKKKVTTPIEELEDLEEENEEELSSLKPKVGIRNDAGNYDLNSDFGGEMEERTIPKQSNNNGNNLMAAALAMQKERDSEK